MPDPLDNAGLANPVPGESDADARRRLCLAAMAGAPGLMRYAARFAPSLEDAEDAYQRGMEVALTKGPIGPVNEFIAWLQVVIRNEAISAHRRLGREAPAGDDIDATVDDHGVTGQEPSAVAEWRERYRTLQDAMTSLNEAERVCLLLRTAGVSRAEIGSMTGFTDRKVERSIVRARKRLHAWHLDLASGERCAKLQEALERVGDGEADSRERKMVSRHIRHCGPCRATLRARRETNAGILTLVPVAVVGAGAVGLAVPDPGMGAEVVSRGTARLTVAVGQAWQTMVDLPALMSARVGAGALAITVAGIAGVPVVANSVRGDGAATTPATQTIRTTAQAASTGGDGAADVGAGATGADATQDALIAEVARLREQAAEREHAEAAEARRRAARERDAARKRREAERRDTAGSQATGGSSASAGSGATASSASAAGTQSSANGSSGSSGGSSSASSSSSPAAATPAAQPQLEFGP